MILFKTLFSTLNGCKREYRNEHLLFIYNTFPVFVLFKTSTNNYYDHGFRLSEVLEIYPIIANR